MISPLGHTKHYTSLKVKGIAGQPYSVKRACSLANMTEVGGVKAAGALTRRADSFLWL